MHHIIVDGVSAVLIIQQILKYYQALLNSENIAVEENPSYIQYINYEEKYLCSEKFCKDEQYWLEKFKTVPEGTTVAKARDSLVNMRVKRQYYSFNPDLQKKVYEFIKDSGSNLFILLTAALMVYCSRFLRKTEIVVGRAVHNRMNQHFRKMVGMFVTNLPFRISINENLTFDQMVKRMQNELWRDLRHQEYPYDLLVNKLRESNYGFQNLINIQISENPSFQAKEYEIIQHYFAEYQQTELFFLLNPRNRDELEIALDYQCSKFADSDIDALMHRLLVIMENLIDNSKKLIREIPTVNKEEYYQVVNTFNNTKQDYPNQSIPKQFKTIVGKYSDQFAVKSAVQSLTYRQLDQFSDVLAAELIGRGVKKHELVALVTDRSVWYVVGILAVLKSGAAYLPIDANYPEERQKYILDDGEVNFVLIDDTVTNLGNFGKQVIRINDFFSVSAQSIVPITNEPDDLAYAMYTSGTTGNPKAALITHRNITRLVKKPNYIKINAGDKIVMTGSISFDASTFEIWGALLNGGCVYVATKEQIISPATLKSIIISEKADILWLTAPLFNNIVEEQPDVFDTLKYLIVGGDVLSPRHIAKVFYRENNVQIINGYGPTENTTFSTCHLIDKVSDEPIPIGRPISNSTAYVLDPALQPLPIGAVGELCVGGDGVGLGYWKRPELTREKFIPDPFKKGGRLYRTGDFAYWNNNGALMFVGRQDNQLKIRGHRVELLEIENQIMATLNLSNVTVIAFEDEPKAGKYLVAFYKSLGLEPDALQSRLLQVLPDYMVPVKFIALDILPLNENGKVNREQLRKIFQE